MAGRHRLGAPGRMPAWGIELYRRQRLAEARLDQVMADGAQVRANLQALIAEATSKVEELVNQPVPDDRSAEVEALQGQLDAIDSDIAAAREQFASVVAPGEPVTEEPVTEEPVEQPVVDPNAPSRAPGF